MEGGQEDGQNNDSELSEKKNSEPGKKKKLSLSMNAFHKIHIA